MASALQRAPLMGTAAQAAQARHATRQRADEAAIRAPAANGRGRHETAAPAGTGRHPPAVPVPAKAGGRHERNCAPAEAGDKLHDAIVRGARAKELLGNELLQEVFARLDAEYISAWRQMPARDVDGRERLWQAVNIVGKVKDHLTTILNNGKLAQRELDDLAGRQSGS